MVEHGNVVNFFAGIDQRIGTDPGVWLAVTSISFDISVLELLWTLARGFTVVLHGDELRLKGQAMQSQVRLASASGERRPLDFGSLLLECGQERIGLRRREIPVVAGERALCGYPRLQFGVDAGASFRVIRWIVSESIGHLCGTGDDYEERAVAGRQLRRATA